MAGFFITFEGIEGSGKSTQIALLETHLKNAGHAVLRTREPGGTALGERIRSLLLDDRTMQIDPRSELLLYLAGRIQHVAEVIAPALAHGKIVLCDRFSDATVAYQGDGRGLPVGWVRWWIATALQGFQPDLTFLFDLDVTVALARLPLRGEMNRFDQETVVFHEAVRKGYLRLARQNRCRIQVVQADDRIETIFQALRKRVDAVLS
jgi:dTMP kinase